MQPLLIAPKLIEVQTSNLVLALCGEWGHNSVRDN